MASINKRIIEQMAIDHDNQALIWFKIWKRSGKEYGCAYTVWHEHNAKRDAMLDLLDMVEPGTHIVYDDVVTTLEELEHKA